MCIYICDINIYNQQRICFFKIWDDLVGVWACPYQLLFLLEKHGWCHQISRRTRAYSNLIMTLINDHYKWSYYRNIILDATYSNLIMTIVILTLLDTIDLKYHNDNDISLVSNNVNIMLNMLN